LVPTGWRSLKRSIERVNNPYQACCQIYHLVQLVTQHVKEEVAVEGPGLLKCLLYCIFLKAVL
jgi:hypothetical protein